jgi:hypothetical protein
MTLQGRIARTGATSALITGQGVVGLNADAAVGEGDLGSTSSRAFNIYATVSDWDWSEVNDVSVQVQHSVASTMLSLTNRVFTVKSGGPKGNDGAPGPTGLTGPAGADGSGGGAANISVLSAEVSATASFVNVAGLSFTVPAMLTVAFTIEMFIEVISDSKPVVKFSTDNLPGDDNHIRLVNDFAGTRNYTIVNDFFVGGPTPIEFQMTNSLVGLNGYTIKGISVNPSSDATYTIEVRAIGGAGIVIKAGSFVKLETV